VTVSSNTRKAIEDLLKSFEAAQRTPSDVRLLNRSINTISDLVNGPSSSLDIKIASSAIEEMSRAFTMFAPFRNVRKVSIFGSARTTPDSPIYELTAATAKALAAHHFMVVTGLLTCIPQRLPFANFLETICLANFVEKLTLC
jgi:hypothetical protein